MSNNQNRPPIVDEIWALLKETAKSQKKNR